MGQLVDPVALLKGEVELKSPFFHCKKSTSQFVTLRVDLAPSALPVNCLPDGPRLSACLQLMKQPHGMWIQRSDNTNNGVTAGASRVRKKLRVSREEMLTLST